LATSADPNPTFTFPASGSYEVALTVTDDDGSIDTTRQTVLVHDARSIYVLSSDASGAFTLSGKAEVNIPGRVFVNSDSSKAIWAGGWTDLQASSIEVVGGVKTVLHARVSPEPISGVQPIADPLEDLAAPADATYRGTVRCGWNDTEVLEPGVYDEIRAHGNCQLTLNPGDYVIKGGGLHVKGSASLSGAEVMIYNAGANFPAEGGATGKIHVGWFADVNLTAPTSGPYTGVLLFQARDNARRITFSNANLELGGTIYAPAAQLVLNGSADVETSIIVDRLRMSGFSTASLATEADTTNDTVPVSAPGELLQGEVLVSMRSHVGELSDEYWKRLDDAIDSLNATFAPYNVSLVELDSADYEFADVQIEVATTSECGSMADGVLGCTTRDGQVTMIDGWDWYLGIDAATVGPTQYDLQTTITHELGHAIGMMHSGDVASVMYAMLQSGEAKRNITAADLERIDEDDDQGGGAEALLAMPLDRGTLVQPHQARTDLDYQNLVAAVIAELGRGRAVIDTSSYPQSEPGPTDHVRTDRWTVQRFDPIRMGDSDDSGAKRAVGEDEDGEGLGGGLAAAVDAVLSLEDNPIWRNFATTS
jgi:PKD repeat protein